LGIAVVISAILLGAVGWLLVEIIF
jgi:hypothetical protein